MLDRSLSTTLPALIVGLLLLIYWVRVMQMVRATRKKAGHHANLIPEEKLGRILRILWIPAVVLWIAMPLMFAFNVLTDFAPARPLVLSPLLQWPATAVALAAFVLTWICWNNMGKSWRMGIDPNEKTQLVFSGPFAYVRNPIYGLSSLLMVMTVLILPTPAMIVVGILHLLFLQWEVRREEVYLLAAHGEPYAAYLRHVGRFLPRSFRRYHPQ